MQKINNSSRINHTFISTGIVENVVVGTITFFLAAMVIGSLCVACSRTDEGDKIRALIANGAVLAEAHDIAGMLALASEDIRAMPMDLNRRGIKGVLWRTFNYYGPLSILYPRPVVEIKNDVDEAWAEFPFLIVKKEQNIPGLEKLREDPMAWIEAIGKHADLYHLRLMMIQHKGDWLVDSVHLERFTGAGFEE